MTGHTRDHPGLRRNRWSLPVWLAAAVLLALPAVAMRFTDEVNWDAFDFAVMGTMLATACGLVELATRLSGSVRYRAAFALAVTTGFLLVWINLAVGIIGSERDPANALYAGVLATAALGALIARFRAAGMATALVATALAHAIVAVFALYRGWEHPWPLNLVFVALWLASAGLFELAAREPRRGGAAG